MKQPVHTLKYDLQIEIDYLDNLRLKLETLYRRCCIWITGICSANVSSMVRMVKQFEINPTKIPRRISLWPRRWSYIILALVDVIVPFVFETEFINQKISI